MSNRPSHDRSVPGLLTWGCGCQQDPMAPVGDYLFRCDQHPIELRFCPVCDEVVKHWEWTPASHYRFQPCGHSSFSVIARSTSGPVPA